jgi:hypothetical protein
MKANDPARPERAFWLKFTLLVPPKGGPGKPLAEVWAIRFDREHGHRAGKASFAASDATMSGDGLAFRVGDCGVLPGRTWGALGEGEGRIAWDLRLEHAGQEPVFLFPYTNWYEGGFPKNKAYTSNPALRFDGTLSVGSAESLAVSGYQGMLGHNWGRSHNPRYHWAQCSLWEGREPGCKSPIFEGFSAKIRVGPWLSPWLTVAILRLDGEEFRFDRPWGLFNRSVNAGFFAWSFAAARGDAALSFSVEAPREDFAGLRYLDPDGTENACLNSKIASCRLNLRRKAGGRWVDAADLRGRSSCAYEILTQERGHGVELLV